MRVPPTQAESFHEERPTHPPKSRKLSGSSGPSSPVRSGSVTSSGKFYKLYPVLFLGGRTGCHRSDHTGAHVNVRHVCRRKPGNPPQSTDITAETLKQGFLPRIRLPLCRLECRNRLVRAFASHSFLFDLHFEPELLMFAVFFFPWIELSSQTWEVLSYEGSADECSPHASESTCCWGRSVDLSAKLTEPQPPTMKRRVAGQAH